jgi:serine/threonine protein kinase
VDIGPDSHSQAESGKVPFVAPTPDELAKPFPQLEILGFIGQGGMGAVYKARQKALDRIVALKILPPGIGKDPAFAERFTREAKALAKLNHPGIVTLYEFGQADGLFYFLMEFVDGVNLRQLLEAGRLSPREALAIVPQICDALQYAHDQGIVHRDIKPENILLDRQGRVKVADFGLAKLVGAEGESSAAGGVAPGSVVLTEAGKVMGTPQYMAPEQREHPAEVDHRVDIYSLGVVLYQMLTGELPGKRIEPPSHKVQVDVRIDEIVLRALERTPELRYQTAADFRTQIETVVNDPGTASPANRTDDSAPRRLNVGTSLVTTPEQLDTFDGQFFLYRRKSQMFLEDRQLTFARGGTTTVIPLAAIRDLSIGHYPRTMHPAGLDFISVTYDEGGQTKRLFFSPYESWFGLPSHFNQFVAEWFNAIRAAVVAATGREPGTTPAEQLGVPSGSKAMYALYALMLGPAVLTGIFLLAGVVIGVYRFEGHAATHSLLGGWVIILGVLAVGLLVLTFGRLFGRAPKPTMPTPPGETGPPTPTDSGWQAENAGGFAHLERVKNARRLVRWPATGLMAIGLCFPAAAACFFALGQWPANWQDALVLFCVLGISYVIILGSWRMRQLQDYRMAVLAAIVSLVVTLPGLPLAAFPIWALMVLYRPDVRAAFNDTARKGASGPPAPGPPC